MLLKKLLCLVLAVTTAIAPLSANAVDLGKAFDNLIGPGVGVTVNQPGRYQSGARNSFSGGGVDVRVPRATNVPQLFSISPPRIEAGCNGISAHFGGFSFISGKEFEALLKQIASGAALGFVTSLVMKTLCPPCEAIVQELKTAAQYAANLAKNSCQFGAKLGREFLAGLGTSPSSEDKCALTVSNNNGSQDALFSFSSLCNSLEGVSETLHDWNSKLGANGDDPQKKKAVQEATKCEMGEGNRTWTRLSTFDKAGMWGSEGSSEAFDRKIILMNLMGADMAWTSAHKTGCQLGDGQDVTFMDAKELKEMFCPPPLSADQMVGYYMCGSPQSLKDLSSLSAGSSIFRYCANIFTNSATDTGNKAWKCTSERPGDDGNTGCDILRLDDIDKVFKGKGFLVAVNELLREAVARVRNNESLSADISRGSTTFRGRNIIALIQTAPYPLYQAINAAAVYPSATEDLIDNLSVLVAEQFAYAQFDEVIRITGRSSTATAVCISKPQADKMLEFIEKLRSINYERRKLLAANFQMQQAITEQIRQVNLAIQRQVMTEDMLATGRVANALNKAVSQNIVRESPAAP